MGEPSVEDTIAILRGLKGRYEAHHKGVRIKDSALVAAANLSNRYITDRFLPDKAIDLMDEATSRLAMELESVPTEIDEVQRRLVQLELAAPATFRRDRGARQDRFDGHRRRDEGTATASWPICASSGKPKSMAWATCRPSARSWTRSSSNSATCAPRLKSSNRKGCKSTSTTTNGCTNSTIQQEARRRGWKTPARHRPRVRRRCCARKLGPTKSPRSSVHGPASRSPA